MDVWTAPDVAVHDIILTEQGLMSTSGSVSMNRWAVVLALLPVVWLVGGCERKSEAPENGASTAGTDAAATPVFNAPEIDQSGMPAGLRKRIDALREMIAATPDSVDSLGALGAIYYVQGQPRAAAKCFDRARELAPEAIHWVYYSGLANASVGDVERATRALERAIGMDAEYTPFYVKLALLLAKRDPERAAGLCKRALELSPGDPTVLYTQGACAEAAGQAEAALGHYQEALELSPQYREAHQAAARVLTALNRAEEAAPHVEAATTGSTPMIADRYFEALLRNGLDSRVLLREAFVLAEQGAFEQAEQRLAMLRDVDRTGVATRRAMAVLRGMQGRYEEAATEYRAVLAARPDAIEVRAELADVLLRLGKFDEAEVEFKAVLAKNPDNRQTLARYVNLLATNQRFEEAEKLLGEASQRQPEAAWTHFELGRVLFTQEKDAAARAEFEACLAKQPEHTKAMYSLGVVARRAGDLDEARKRWEQVIEKNPKVIEPYVSLAELGLSERDFAEGERWLRAGLEQAPDAPGLANGLAWILATSTDDEQRNGAEAVRLAEKVCELTKRGRHEYLDTLAAAYAEVGRFDEAVKTATESVRLADEAGAKESAETYRQRSALYEKQQPYRDSE